MRLNLRGFLRRRRERRRAAAQIAWGLDYIRREYGPGAVRHEGGFGWKDAGPP